MADEAPVKLILTKEQRELVMRMSGQNIEAIELTPDETDRTKGKGGMLRFLWHLSTASGIPRHEMDG